MLKRKYVALLFLLVVAAVLTVPGRNFNAAGNEIREATPALILQQERQVAEGIVFRNFQGSTVDDKPLVVQVLEVDTSVPGVDFSPVLPQQGVSSRQRLSEMAAGNGAIAAVNGGFYVSGSGLSYPVGHLVIDGQPQTEWNVWRPSVAITDSGWKMGQFQPLLKISLSGDRNVLADKINSPPENQDVVLYTPAWGQNSLPGNGRIWVELKGDLAAGAEVVAVTSVGTGVEPGKMILSLPPGGSTDWAVSGQRLNFSYTYPPEWGDIKHLLTAGPLLVEAGKPVFEAMAEGFDGSILDRNPRSALAVNDQGKILLVTVDGRYPQESVGLTFEELSLLLVSLGARDAVGLDGGGSTEMWVNGQVVNSPSDGTERLLPNALVVKSGIPIWLNGKRIFFDVQPRVVQGRTLVPVRGLFEALGGEVSWDQKQQIVGIKLGEKYFKLPIGSKKVLINDSSYLLDVPAQLINDRTMVPLRFIMESLGAAVEWNQAKEWVKIYVN